MALRSTQPPPEGAEPKKDMCTYCGVIPQWKYDYMPDSFTEQFAEYCHSHAFWHEILEGTSEKVHFVRREDNEIRVYTLGEPAIDWAASPSFLGFGGHWWFIKTAEGEGYITNNLWSRGTVPSDMTSLFKDRINVCEMRAAAMQEIRTASEGRRR